MGRIKKYINENKDRLIFYFFSTILTFGVCVLIWEVTKAYNNKTYNVNEVVALSKLSYLKGQVDILRHNDVKIIINERDSVFILKHNPLNDKEVVSDTLSFESYYYILED